MRSSKQATHHNPRAAMHGQLISLSEDGAITERLALLDGRTTAMKRQKYSEVRKGKVAQKLCLA
uniref:Uncharacterized protein n=1 Tax=Arundo donax TaxID=35708 RepID=A0A0A9B0N3_ARUDO